MYDVWRKDSNGAQDFTCKRTVLWTLVLASLTHVSWSATLYNLRSNSRLAPRQLFTYMLRFNHIACASDGWRCNRGADSRHITAHSLRSPHHLKKRLAYLLILLSGTTLNCQSYWWSFSRSAEDRRLSWHEHCQLATRSRLLFSH